MVTDDPWLDDAQLRAWITVLALLETLPTAIDGQLKRESGVNRFEYSVLAMLSASEDHSLPMSDLAGAAFGSLSRLSHAVGRLERRGWVERCPGSFGRRHTVARLTEQGRIELERAAPGHAREVRRLLVDPLSDDELQALAAIAAKVLASIDPARWADVERITALIALEVDPTDP